MEEKSTNGARYYYSDDIQVCRNWLADNGLKCDATTHGWEGEGTLGAIWRDKGRWAAVISHCSRFKR